MQKQAIRGSQRLAWGRARAVAMLLAALLAPAVPAAAQVPQAAVGCEVSDFSVALRLYLPLLADGSGSPDARGFQGTLEIRHLKMPRERRFWTLDGKRPVQFWNRDNALKMLIVVGAGEGQIRLILDTARGPDGPEYRGTFRLQSSEVNVTGRLACTVG